MTAPADALTVPCEGIGVWDGASLVATGGARLIVGRGRAASDGVWSAMGDYHLLRDLSLDLTHGPTRAWMLAMLAERHGATLQGVWRWVGHPGRPGWELLTETVRIPFAARGWSGWKGYPALADLDPTDDTRLPDGARVVDVRALALVLGQVFRATR